MKPSHFEVKFPDTGGVMVKFNPAAFKAAVHQKGNKYLTSKTQIIFNTNFNWLGRPLGELWENNRSIGKSPTYKRRPIFVVSDGVPYIVESDSKTLAKVLPWHKWFSMQDLPIDVAFEAGPILRSPGLPYVNGKTRGEFKDDVTRKTAHTLLAVTREYKVIVYQHSFVSLLQAEDNLMEQYPTITDIMNMDGGSASGIQVLENGKLVVGRGLPPSKMAVGARFYRN